MLETLCISFTGQIRYKEHCSGGGGSGGAILSANHSHKLWTQPRKIYAVLHFVLLRWSPMSFAHFGRPILKRDDSQRPSSHFRLQCNEFQYNRISFPFWCSVYLSVLSITLVLRLKNSHHKWPTLQYVQSSAVCISFFSPSSSYRANVNTNYQNWHGSSKEEEEEALERRERGICREIEIDKGREQRMWKKENRESQRERRMLNRIKFWFHHWGTKYPNYRKSWI